MVPKFCPFFASVFSRFSAIVSLSKKPGEMRQPTHNLRQHSRNTVSERATFFIFSPRVAVYFSSNSVVFIENFWNLPGRHFFFCHVIGPTAFFFKSSISGIDQSIFLSFEFSLALFPFVIGYDRQKKSKKNLKFS